MQCICGHSPVNYLLTSKAAKGAGGKGFHNNLYS